MSSVSLLCHQLQTDKSWRLSNLSTWSEPVKETEKPNPRRREGDSIALNKPDYTFNATKEANKMEGISEGSSKHTQAHSLPTDNWLLYTLFPRWVRSIRCTQSSAAARGKDSASNHTRKKTQETHWYIRCFSAGTFQYFLVLLTRYNNKNIQCPA